MFLLIRPFCALNIGQRALLLPQHLLLLIVSTFNTYVVNSASFVTFHY